MNCHICSSEYGPEIAGKVRGVFRCPDCEHVFRRPPGDQIEYHAETYRNQKVSHRTKGEFDGEGNVTGNFHKARKKIVEDRLKLVQQYLHKDFVCLDVGAGAGTFARIIEPHVKRVDCTELAPPLIVECQRLGFTTYAEDFLTLDINERYDIVFAWHVLEHVEDTNSFIKKMKELATKHLIIEIPINRRMRADHEYDGHVHYFSGTSFQTLLSNHHLAIHSVGEGVQNPALLAVCSKYKE